MIPNLFFRRLHTVKYPVVDLDETQNIALAEFRRKLSENEYVFESSACLCGETDGLLIGTIDRYMLPVHTYLCRNCGIMWTNPRMDSASLAKFYDEDYRAIYMGTPQATEDVFRAQIKRGRRILESVSTAIDVTSERTVFDIGTGAGGALVPFQEVGWRAYGCDLGSEYLKFGQARGLSLLHGEIDVLAQYGPADLIILSHLLEHLPDPRGSLEIFAQHLSHAGYIYIELPGIFNIHSSRSYRRLLRFLQNAHLYHFTLTTLTSLLADVGFRLTKGDEWIHALYERDPDVPAVSTCGQYRKILLYLYWTEWYYRWFRLIEAIRNRTRVIRKVFCRQ